MDYLFLFKHLLPTARSWRMTIEKTLKLWFQGLTIVISDAREYLDSVFADVFPETTTALSKWLSEFNLVSSGDEATDRLSLAGAWRLNEYQSPKQIQDTLQAAGFDLYVSEWWVAGTEPPELKNPFMYINNGNLLFIPVCGQAEIQCGENDAQAGNFIQSGDGYPLVNKTGIDQVYDLPVDETFWHYIFYVGADNFPDYADMPAERKNELETLLLKISPTEQWIGVMVNYI